jgi:hypothetical protein
VVKLGKPFDRKHPLEPGGVKLTTYVPLQFKKRGIKKVVVGPSGVDQPVVFKDYDLPLRPNHDQTLIRGLGRGFYWHHLVELGMVADATEIAQREEVHRVTILDGQRFALLAPDIVEAALNGSLPRNVSFESLQRVPMPLDWDEQRRVLIGS